MNDKTDSDMNENSDTTETTATSTPRGWRYRLGMILFFGAFPVFFATPIVIAQLNLSAAESAALIGGILLAVEVLWLVSIPLLGKKGFNEVKKRAFGWLSFLSEPVGRTRHLVGLWLLLGSLVVDVALNLSLILHDLLVDDATTTFTWLGLQQSQASPLITGLQAATTLGVIAGALILGAEFWERLRQAFKWRPEESIK